MLNYYGPCRADHQAFLLGPAGECASRAQSYFEAGVETLIVASVTAELKYLDQLNQEFLPRLANA